MSDFGKGLHLIQEELLEGETDLWPVKVMDNDLYIILSFTVLDGDES